MVAADNLGYYGNVELDLREPGSRIGFWLGCRAGLEVLGIESNGDVKGCLSLSSGLNGRTDFVEGNLRETPLVELWRSGRYFVRFRDQQARLHGHCARCAYARECRAGCSAVAYSATGSLGCNPYCIRHLETQQILGAAVGPYW